jgi:hypothetical protein
MSRWYRAYEGTTKDDKLAEAAIIAETSKSVVIASWHALLESAAAAQSGGAYETTARRIAAVLGEPVAVIEAVIAAFEEIGLVRDGQISAWQRRQFESDTSTERSRRHREAKRNAPATLQQQDATPPYTETDTDKENRNLPVSAKEPAGQKSGKGTRLSAEYQLPEPDSAFAASLGVPALLAAKEFEQFRDYWTAKPGKDGVKLDWSATWRNWIRRFAEKRGFAPAAEPGAPSKPTATTITPGTAQWKAWYEFKRSTGTPTRLMDEAAANERPFPVPTEWPPQAEPKAA